MNTAKGARRAVEVACVAWIDLLGYGAQLKECGFDPTSTAAQSAIERLQGFHLAVASQTTRGFFAFVMNDGAVMYRDLSPRTNSVTSEFVIRAVGLHEHVNRVDHASGFPGARMVVAAGFRVRSRAKPVPSGVGAAIVRRLDDGKISVKSAIREALWARPVFGEVPELQGNFAFTKAFVADHDGSRVGLVGPCCYVDMALFSSPHPEWLQVSKLIPWRNERLGLEAQFGLVEGIDRAKARATGERGVLDAFALARRLSGSVEVVREIRKRRLTDSLRPKPA